MLKDIISEIVALLIIAAVAYFLVKKYAAEPLSATIDRISEAAGEYGNDVTTVSDAFTSPWDTLKSIFGGDSGYMTDAEMREQAAAALAAKGGA